MDSSWMGRFFAATLGFFFFFLVCFSDPSAEALCCSCSLDKVCTMHR
jgi:hypothetical protein